MYRMNLDISPKKFTMGSIEMFLNWSNRVDGEGTEPAMYFRRKMGDNRQVVGLRLSEIHNFIASSGYGLGAAVAMGMRIAEQVGCAVGDKFAARDVVDLIVEYTEDLVKMPAEPPNQYQLQQAAMHKAELAILIDGETVMEAEVAA